MIQRVTTASLALTAVMLTLGCGGSSIYRHESLEPEKKTEVIVTDAKQRIVFARKGERSGTFVGRIEPSILMCAEPSPDVAQAVQTSVVGSLTAALSDMAKAGQASGSAQAAATIAESVSQLGKRIATIQLLRDEFADLCRSYINGAVSATTYTVRLSRLDKKMITLLATEGIAGTLPGGGTTILGMASGSTSNQSTDDKLKAAHDQVAKDKSEVEKASTALKNATDADRTVALSALNSAQLTLQQSQMQLLIATSKAAGSSVGATLSEPANAGVASSINDYRAAAIAEVQRAFLAQDDLGTIVDACIAAMDIVVEPVAADKILSEKRKVSAVAQKQRDESIKQATSELEKTEEDLRDARTAIETVRVEREAIKAIRVVDRSEAQKKRLEDLELKEAALESNYSYLGSRRDSLKGRIEKLTYSVPEPILSPEEAGASVMRAFCEKNMAAIMEMTRIKAANALEQARIGERILVWSSCKDVLSAKQDPSNEGLRKACQSSLDRVYEH